MHKTNTFERTFPFIERMISAVEASDKIILDKCLVEAKANFKPI